MPDTGRRPSITVNREACSGSGICIAYAPATFCHDYDTKAIVIDPCGDSLEALLAAAEGCPTEAITLINQEGE